MRCYNCGGDVFVNWKTRVGVCSACGMDIPLPESGAEEEAAAAANLLLSEHRFDEAKAAFRDLIVRFPTDDSYCWGMALSEYGIEYVKDPIDGRLVPTLHRLSSERFSEYIYVKKAISTVVSLNMKQFYEEQAALIDRIQGGSLAISVKEEPYDVFICYKKTEEGEKRTADARIAEDVYRDLIRRGYKVFYAEETLKVGEEYEPRIYAALHSAHVMVAIGSKREYYDAVWVRNEWSRYLALIEEERARGEQSRLLIPYYRRLTRSELPKELAALDSGVAMDEYENPKNELYQRITAWFDLDSDEATRTLRRQGGGAGSTYSTESTAENVAARGRIQLANREFDKADATFRRSLEMKPTPDAWIGILMARLQTADMPHLLELHFDPGREEEFARAWNLAKESGSRAKLEELHGILTTCRGNLAHYNACLERYQTCDQALTELENDLSSRSLPTAACREFTKRETAYKDMMQKAGSRVYFEAETILWIIFLLGGNLIPALLYAVMPYICTFFSIPTTQVRWDLLPAFVPQMIIYPILPLLLLREAGMRGLIKSVLVIAAGGFFVNILSELLRDQKALLIAAAFGVFGLRFWLWKVAPTLHRRRLYRKRTREAIRLGKRAGEAFRRLEAEVHAAQSAIKEGVDRFRHPDLDWDTMLKDHDDRIHSALVDTYYL